MAEFSSLEPNQPSIPYAPSSNPYGLGDLTNPDNVLSGQSRGTQSIGGSTNIQSDPSGQRLVVNDNTTNRVSFGRIGTGVNDWGMKVSKPGFSVDTATASQLIFNSSQDALKVVLSGSTTLNANATAGVPIVATIPHNQAIIPIPFVFFNYDGLRFTQLPNSTGLTVVAGQVGLNNWSWATTDATNLYINFYSGATTNWGIFTYTYYLLQETAG